VTRLSANSAADRGEYPADLRRILSRAEAAKVRETVAAWEGYAPTPLRSLPGIASSLGIRQLWHKDESSRFGLGSFKALGGAYAVYRILFGGAEPSSRAAFADTTFAAATAGNHGRSVAWAARRFGVRCVLYVPATVSEERVRALRAEGAEVVVFAASYEATVERLAADAARHGWLVVSDTSYPGYTDVPRHVMQGYTVMVDEIIEQLPDNERLTHVFLQCGVGGLAAAVASYLWETYGSKRPTIIVVEPASAACFLESIRRGRMTESRPAPSTSMVCLACARLSVVAWSVLSRAADFGMTITDEAAVEATKTIAAATGNEIACGESGAAGLAGLMTAAAHGSSARRIGLDRDSSVLVIGSEGLMDRG
jgi:diaminopropionate ammonia-lyase